MSTSIKQISGRIDAALRSPWQMRAMAIVEAIVANVVILIVGRVVNGEFPMATVGDDDQTIGFAQVIVVTALVGLVAWDCWRCWSGRHHARRRSGRRSRSSSSCSPCSVHLGAG